MKLRHLMLLGVLLLLTACAGKPAQQAKPDWVNAESARYSSASYLLGRGVAQNLDDAKDRARADLAKNFEVAVLEKYRDQQSFERTQQQGETSEQYEQHITRNLTAQTSRTLHAVEIADIWHDEANRQFYALAALSRMQARERLMQDMTRLDEKTRLNIRLARDEPSPLGRIGAAQQAVTAQQQRLVLQQSLQVVDRSGRGHPSEWALPKLVANRDELIARVRIHPRAGGDLPGQMLGAALAHAGFRISDQPGEADYVLEARLQLDRPVSQGGWIWGRGTLQVDLIDSAGMAQGTRRWPVKAAATQPERTTERLLDEVDKVLKEQLRETLVGFAETGGAGR